MFSNRIAIPIFYSLITSLLLPATIWYIFTSGDVFDIIWGILAFVLVLMIWLVMVWGELRLKIHRIYFTTKGIEVRSFLGIGKKRTYSYDVITGFMIGLQPAYPFPYESITLMLNEKKLLRISQFYFRNYKEIKLLITERFANYQIQKFSLRKAITEIFE
ncbi:MAG: hypothetical protein U1C70_12850 [Sediminibacterium sp.]|nr:hypothetical protein [Sediminibacterium sp.]